jgi:hypothetical protein
MNKRHQTLGAVAFILAVVITLFLIHLEGPGEKPGQSEGNQYSIENVIRHIEKIGAFPRPVGTENNRKTRAYLEEHLTSLGIEKETRAAIAFNARQGTPYRIGYVSNVIGRIRGTGNGDTIVLVAHYDSVPTSSGAADDLSSIASILETLRVLKNEPPAQNDIVVLFSDAEEVGSLGAKSFVDEMPGIEKIKAVINLEARGSSGASLLFETSENNSTMIKSYAASVSHPVGSSFFSDVYKVLPNDTDFTEFRLKGIDGINTAFIEDINNYHTFADNIKNLDKNSVRHQGENLLAIVRDLRNRNLSEDASGRLIFFDLFGKKLVYYPASLALPLMLAMVALYIAAVYFGRKAQKLTLKGLFIGFFLFLFFLVAEILLSLVFVKFLQVFHKDYKMFMTGDTYNAVYYIYGVVCLSMALVFVFYALFGRKRTPDDLFLGGALVWILLAVLTSFLLSGTSYIFTLSSISFSVACLGGFLWKQKDAADLKNHLLPILGSFTGVILIGGIIRHLILGLGIGFIPVGIFFASLVLGLLIYAILLLERKTRLLVGALLAGGGIVLIVCGLLTVGYSPEKPRQTSLFWALNADTNKAFWATEDIDPNEWNQRVFEGVATDVQLPEILPQSQRFFLTKETQPVDLPTGLVEKISDENRGDSRFLRVKVSSPNASPVITLAIESAGEVAGFEIDGKDFAAELNSAKRPGIPFALRLYGVPANGAEVLLHVKSIEPLKIRIITQNYGFPPSLEIDVNSRPADLVPAPMPFNDSTFVTKLFVF